VEGTRQSASRGGNHELDQIQEKSLFAMKETEMPQDARAAGSGWKAVRTLGIPASLFAAIPGMFGKVAKNVLFLLSSGLAHFHQSSPIFEAVLIDGPVRS